jgi:hypothetical protein
MAEKEALPEHATTLADARVDRTFDALLDQLWPEPFLLSLAERTNEDHVTLSLAYLGWFMNKCVVSRGDSVSVQRIPLDHGNFYQVSVDWARRPGRPLTDRNWFYQSIVKRRKKRLRITYKESAVQFKNDYSAYYKRFMPELVARFPSIKRLENLASGPERPRPPHATHRVLDTLDALVIAALKTR